jgi:hypothetical protein
MEDTVSDGYDGAIDENGGENDYEKGQGDYYGRFG